MDYSAPEAFSGVLFCNKLEFMLHLDAKFLN